MLNLETLEVKFKLENILSLYTIEEVKNMNLGRKLFYLVTYKLGKVLSEELYSLLKEIYTCKYPDKKLFICYKELEWNPVVYKKSEFIIGNYIEDYLGITRGYIYKG